MNKLNLLLVLFVLAFVGIGCSDRELNHAPARMAMEEDWSRYSGFPKPSTPSYVVEVNDSPSFWSSAFNQERYNPSYEHLVPGSSRVLESDVDLAQKAWASFATDSNPYDIESAMIFYSRSALAVPNYLDRAVSSMEKGLVHKVDAGKMAEHALALLEKYPDNERLKNLLPQIRLALLDSLKKDRFTVGQSYVSQESWRDVYGTGHYAVRNIDFLSRIADKMGNKSEYAKFQRYIAEYELNNHSEDGIYMESNPKISHDIYTKLGYAASAKKAATQVGDRFLEVYLNGATDMLGQKTRSYGLPYDLEQAKEWYSKGGLGKSQIAERLRSQVAAAKKNLPGCTTRKECTTEEFDKLIFIEVLAKKASI